MQITGEGFGTNPSVAFGGVAATGVSVNSAGTQIVCTAPAGKGAVNVSVTASGATSPAVEASRYCYAPVLTALSNYTGKPLITQVTLIGEGFIAQSVMFGALSARQVQPSTTSSVTVWAPVTLGRVPVVVMTPGGTSNALDFTYVPAVLSITPSYGTQGTVVRIVGAGLSVDGQPLNVQSVTFGITPALNVWTKGTDEVWAEVPAGAGTVPVVVKTAGGSTANWSGALFGGAPAGGTPLKITGSGFTGATAVMFDGVPGLYLNVPNDNELTVTTPPGTGEVPVVVRLPLAVSGPHEGATFTYGPVVKSLDPNSLSVQRNGRVWITGKGLDRILSIDFCGTRYGAETYGTWWAHGMLNGARTVHLQATPPTDGPGTYDVTVTTPEGTSAPVSFTWTT
ncbi:IPT/TIG domain-containing protein [Ancylobacter rudongensis]|uniref:IPT/TIG domain-containing protein n=1 Tax=Ancylobacter rudongensis TaxID=177413 RepID=A0A1G4PZ10_9HYPH|nr:IPT/TIG domain-containing protein [Ancylobacter rudongensis]SCW37532.1 IPT/TIG domain-containing protein [Ancylobacter rudongensis]